MAKHKEHPATKKTPPARDARGAGRPAPAKAAAKAPAPARAAAPAKAGPAVQAAPAQAAPAPPATGPGTLLPEKTTPFVDRQLAIAIKHLSSELARAK